MPISFRYDPQRLNNIAKLLHLSFILSNNKGFSGRNAWLHVFWSGSNAATTYCQNAGWDVIPYA